MLVAGTTGAGKSEFLRSLVLSLATDYPPSELAMLLVDYKGGASLGDLRRLPHAIGMVSNLSELDVDRLLKFLKRELERRQEILAPFSGEYVEYRRKGQNDLPRLLIVIDEFQGFVQSGDSGSGTSRQQAILNIAARGRSAGVHMVLATQHPSRDVVSAGVLANVSIKACLRTAEGDASSNIIGAPVAASIPQRLRGRLYLTTDRGSLQAVQSAHTKGVTLAGHSTTARITFADQPLFGVAAGLRDDADYLIDLMAGEL